MVFLRTGAFIMSENYSGGCLCGAVRFEARGAPLFAGNCHCRDCQKATGSGYMPVMGFPVQAVTISGEVRYFERIADSGKRADEGFCPACGARLFAHAEELANMVLVQASALDEPARFVPQLDMYTASAQPWDVMDPKLPKFERMPPMGD